MTPNTRTLLDEMIDHLMSLSTRERLLAETLRSGDDTLRTEIALYMADRINYHPAIPAGASTSLHGIEDYISYQIRIANWRVHAEDLDAEWDALGERVGLLDDLDLDDLDDLDLD